VGAFSPQDELELLSQQADQATDLAALKPIFLRLDEIAREYPADFDIQVSVTEVKQRVVARGAAIKAAHSHPPSPPAFDHAQPLTSTGPFPQSPGPSAESPGLFQPPPEENPAAFEAQAAPSPLPRESVPAALSQQDGRAVQAPPERKSSGKLAMALGILAGALVAAAVIFFLRNRAAKAAEVPIQVATAPPGASIRVDGEPKCNSNCAVALKPGTYQISAFLDGYEPGASTIRVTAGHPGSVNLTLAPQPQTVRILTDLPQGQVTIDDRPPANLQEGQFVWSKVPAGVHNVKIVSKEGTASFSVEIAEGKAPVVSSLSAQNLLAVLVSSAGSHARAIANKPEKLALNGQTLGEAGPAGLELTSFRPGIAEFAVGEGRDQRTMSESFGPAPALTAFVKSDQSTGTLIVSTGEDDVRVLLNGKEYPRKTRGGELRIQTLGELNVRVAKDGYELSPPQTAQVKKGSETRLTFKMVPTPKVATLQIRGATPGAEVLVDQKPLGSVSDDGSLANAAVPPGDHTIELRKENYNPKRTVRTFVAGQTVALSGSDVALSAAAGTLSVKRTPADAAVSYRRVDDSQAHDLRGSELQLPPGNYILTARAPGYVEKSERVQVVNGETQTVEIALARIPPPATPAPPKTAGIGDFDDSNAWSKQGDLWVHKGGGFITYKLPLSGTLTFTVRLLHGGSLFRGGKIRWALQYMDPRNYDLFELDRKNLASKVIIAGKTYDRGKFEHGLSEKDMGYTIQIEASPGRLIHRLRKGGDWLVLDTWAEPGRNFTDGKFAFVIQGDDEIGISDFKFVPR
jgi:hypothetical protein